MRDDGNGHGANEPEPGSGNDGPEATLIGIVLDRSGSMGACLEGTIAGFNQFLHAQQREAEGGRALMSLIQFDHLYEVNFVAVPIENVPDLDTRSYVPRGSTALHDAIGRTIHDTEAWTREHGWNQRVLILIVTDGLENASSEYNLLAIRALIERKEREGWNFAYMGANHDSAAVSSSMGMRQTFSRGYSSNDSGVREGFADLAEKARHYRLSKLKGLDSRGFFDALDENQSDPGAGRLTPKS